MKYVLTGLVLVIFSIHLCEGQKLKESDLGYKKRSGTAILMTGAAARIPQEAALLEELYNRGLLKDVVFISGVSSGALNAVMLNGILSGKITWNEYKDILFNLKNSDVFLQKDKKKLPVNSSPERELFRKIVEEKLGYHTIGDLPFPTVISITELKDLDLKRKVYRLCSRKINEETDTTLSLVDIMMATSAFPLAFPPVRIPNARTIPNTEFVDGGIGEDHVPYHGLLEFEKYRGEGVNRVYIVSRKNDSIPEISEELENLGINDKGRFDRMGLSLDKIMMKGIIKRMEEFVAEVPEMAELCFVYFPEFKGHYLMFNFGNLREEYYITSEWAQNNQPVPVKEFLKNFPHRW